MSVLIQSLTSVIRICQCVTMIRQGLHMSLHVFIIFSSVIDLDECFHPILNFCDQNLSVCYNEKTWFIHVPTCFYNILTVIDLDECFDPILNFCDQNLSVCYNEKTGYKCYCMFGYILQADGRTCLREFFTGFTVFY